MFGLIRRISYSVIPRPDRPWEDDPTSNAPNTRRKRRISSTEHEAANDEEQTKKKKPRGEDAGSPGSGDVPSSPIVGATDTSGTANDDVEANADADTTSRTGYTIQREGSLEVKIVTKGVKAVELEDKATSSTDKTITTITTTTTSDESRAPSSESTTETQNAKEETSTITTVINPESIPLPEEKAGELDDIRSSPAPESSSYSREDSTTTAVDDEPSNASEAPKVNDSDDSESLTGISPSRPETPTQSRSSRLVAKPSSSVKKLTRSKSPKKVSAKA